MRRIAVVLTLILAVGGCGFLSGPRDLPVTTYRNSEFNISVNQPKGWVVIDDDHHPKEFASLKRVFVYYKVVCAIAISLDARKGPKVVILKVQDKAGKKSETFEERVARLMPAELAGGSDDVVYWVGEKMYKVSKGGQEVYSYHTKDLRFHLQIFGTTKEIALYKPTLYKIITSFQS